MHIAYPSTRVGQAWEHVYVMNGMLPFRNLFQVGVDGRGEVRWLGGVEGPVGEILVWIVGFSVAEVGQGCREGR
jgi:hypothetical protein